MLNRLNRGTHRLTGGRMDALGILIFIVSFAFFGGLIVEICFGGPS